MLPSPATREKADTAISNDIAASASRRGRANANRRDHANRPRASRTPKSRSARHGGSRPVAADQAIPE